MNGEPRSALAAPDRPLRIAQIAPIARRVTPESTGSVEQIVSLLTDGLVERGHSVTLFATGHSETTATLRSLYPRGYDDDSTLWNWEFHEVMHVGFALEHAREFDVVHSHSYHYALPFTRLVEPPIVHTYHVLPDADVVAGYARYRDALLVAVSDYQRRQFDRPELPVIHHGLATSAFPFAPEGGDYLLFVGNLVSAKGAAGAIEVARSAGMRLVLAGASADAAGSTDYYEQTLLPLLEDPGVEYVGWVPPARRNELLAGAAALVYPINTPETFGLVMVEAMACGTPVLALERGAVPEVVTPGVTGYHAPDVEGLAAKVPAVLELDRRRVRDEAVRRFDARRMVADHEALYRKLSSMRRTERGWLAAQ